MILEYPGVTGSGEIWLDVVRAICGDTSNKSMCDLMCHKAPYTSQLGFKERTYVDILDRGLDNKEEQQYFVQSDVFNYIRNKITSINGNVDIAICSDGIEHLNKKDGYRLLGLMRILAGEKVIIFTPTGDTNISIDDNNPDTHKSAWTPYDFEDCIIINFPDFHPLLKQGALFAIDCCKGINPLPEFERIKSELNNKSWAK